ncbi:carbohydrate porin [Polynucleobacter asymbioticus]|uniref:Carbohydrate-selective porin OprB n=2 Tax=Polynucleobacter asymbioticus TaxID=576611 RepID=A4SWQ7_POLAQ|nr:carbohydrate porin [Polynucleobacter asymbioticus]ABP33921.1 Carbohydrate-selective porin OprB [Polynucleobacter asymbioticus QLW-P1DMWA-1]APB98613.1 porin [Polynucleobacter asymbioticus]APC00899.1 porin [Polynucleobacter asymbioticus]
MTRKLLLIFLLSFLTASVYAQRAGSGADQVESFARPIEGLPTEGTIFDLPVNLHGQTTYINQRYNAFNSPYQGQNSLLPDKSMSYTWSGTLFFGARVASDTDIYFNPEVVSGVPFSGLTGLGGPTNGEATRAQGAQAHFYSARAFLRQTINQEGGKVELENDANQISQTVSSNRFVITAGQFSTLDIFDDSKYAKDPRVQFMNWGNMTYLSYDYAADARGYSWGLAGEWYRDNWVFRASRMLAPKDPNGRDLNWQIFNSYGDQLEVERQHSIGDLPGKVSVLGYRNRMVMARFTDATNYLIANQAQGTQAILNVRNSAQVKTGIGLNAEQALTKDMGIYMRAFTSDGHTETMAFAEADSSLSVGMGINGERWGRAKDTIGLSAMLNGISSNRRAYLQAGGISNFIGDTPYPYAGPSQSISYKPEQISEVYYNALVIENVLLGLNYQHIMNPAYNAARGPVNVVSFRVHAEF